MGDVLEDLERLVRLRDAGALTAEEFEAQKARLLGATVEKPTVCSDCGAPLQLDPAGRCIYCGQQTSLAPSAIPAGADASADPVADSIVRDNPKNKIFAIKSLRQQTGIGLAEAKERIETAFARAGKA